MKKIYLMVLLLCLFVSPAFAFDLGGYIGPIQMHVTLYSWGRVYGTTSDPFPFDHSGLGSGRVDTYGLVSIDTIDGYDTSTLTWTNIWTSKPTEAIEGMFWGLKDDVGYVNGDGKVVFNEIGGKVELHLDNSRDLSIVSNPQVPPNGTPNWKPTDLYNALDGQLFLTADFVPGIIIGDATHTYSETIDALTKPFTGSGHGYLAINNDGGLYNNLFNGNGFLNGSADLLMGVNIQGNAGNPNWTLCRDPIQGNIVPEPTSMLLFGLGIAGLATLRRKKVA